MIKVIEGMKPWEVMKAAEEGKRVAFIGSRPVARMVEVDQPAWDWTGGTYFIIDDAQPAIDWDGFWWEFFNQYGGIRYLDKHDVFQMLTDPLSDELRDFVCLSESPPYPWLGDKQPVPDGVEVEIEFMQRDLDQELDEGVKRVREVMPADAVKWSNPWMLSFRLTGRVL